LAPWLPGRRKQPGSVILHPCGGCRQIPVIYDASNPNVGKYFGSLEGRPFPKPFVRQFQREARTHGPHDRVSQACYCDLGSVMEVIGGTLIKGKRWIVETISWQIIPADDLDD
jgi:hypothetical protein